VLTPPLPRQVIEGKIYLTNYRGAENVDELKKRGIRHIVCVNEQENEHADKFRYFNISTLEDQEDNDASPHFQAVKEFTDDALLSGGAMLLCVCVCGLFVKASQCEEALPATTTHQKTVTAGPPLIGVRKLGASANHKLAGTNSALPTRLLRDGPNRPGNGPGSGDCHPRSQFSGASLCALRGDGGGGGGGGVLLL